MPLDFLLSELDY